MIDDTKNGLLARYGWTLLAIQYLQIVQPPILPSLHQSSLDPSSSSYASSAHLSLDLLTKLRLLKLSDFESWTSKLDGFIHPEEDLKSHFNPSLNKQSLDELLFGFFKYYSEFDFKNKVVSVRCGHPVHDLFPPPTFIAIESETRPRHGFDPRRFITIEDVYDVWDNVARGVGELELQRIQWELLVASRILESYARQYDKVRVSQGLLQPVTLPMDLMTQLFGNMPKTVSRSQSPTKQRGKGKPKKPAPIAPPSGPTRLVFSPPSPPALSKKNYSYSSSCSFNIVTKR